MLSNESFMVSARDDEDLISEDMARVICVRKPMPTRGDGDELEINKGKKNKGRNEEKGEGGGSRGGEERGVGFTSLRMRTLADMPSIWASF